MNVGIPDLEEVVPVRDDEQDAAEDAQCDFLPYVPGGVGDNRGERDDRESRGSDSRDPVALMVTETKTESEETGRDDSPEQPLVKMRICAQSNEGDRQYRHEQRHCEAVQNADRR